MKDATVGALVSGFADCSRARSRSTAAGTVSVAFIIAYSLV